MNTTSQTHGSSTASKPTTKKTWFVRLLEWFSHRIDECTAFSRAHPGFSRTFSVILLFVYIAACALYIRTLEPGQGEDRAQRLFSYCPTVIALSPSLLALGHFIIRRRRTPSIHNKTVQAYLEYRKDFANRFCASGKQPVSLGFLNNTDEKEIDYLLRPRPGQYLLGACALALPFLVLSIFSDALHGVRGNVWLVTGGSGLPFQEGIRGLVFTGYGIYVYTLIVILHRMHAEALSAEFLLGAALRALTMMLIGFMVGETGLFITQAAPELPAAQASFVPADLPADTAQTLSAPTGASMLGLFVYFALGAFPFWGYEALRSKARRVLQPHTASEKIPLEYVDGLDEMIIERLEELGIGNAQHLATSDPVMLTLRTNYPFGRIIDWINQAILITHLQDRIRVARELGIRSATDLRRLYEDLQKGKPTQRLRILLRRRCPHCRQFMLGNEAERARTLLQQLADGTRTSVESIYAIGAKLADDFHVTLLNELWQDRCICNARSSNTKGRLLAASWMQRPGAHRAASRNGAPAPAHH